MCIKDNEKSDNIFYDEEENETYKKFYDIVHNVLLKVLQTSHNCTKCITDYHLIYNQTGENKIYNC